MAHEDETVLVREDKVEPLDQRTTMDDRTELHQPGEETTASKDPVAWSPARLAPEAGRSGAPNTDDQPTGTGLSLDDADSLQIFKRDDLMKMVRGAAAGFADSITTEPEAEALDDPKPVQTKLAPIKPAEIKPVEIKPAEIKPAETKLVDAPKPSPSAGAKLAPEPGRKSLFESDDPLPLQFEGEAPPPMLEVGLLVEVKEGSKIAKMSRPVNPEDVRVSGGEAPASPFTTFDIPPALAMVLVPSVAKRPEPSTPGGSTNPPASPSSVYVMNASAGNNVPAPKQTQLPSISSMAAASSSSATPSNPRLPVPASFNTPAAPMLLDPIEPAPAKSDANEPKTPKQVGKKAKKAPRPASSPPASREEPAPNELDQVLAATSLTRVIPIALVTVLLIVAFFALRKPATKVEDITQTHVEMRFVVKGKDGLRPLVVVSKTMTKLHIKTDPPGCLVLFNRDVLGRTPLEAELPIQLTLPVAVELSSPYFGTAVEELTKDEKGEFYFEAKLKPQ